ncbi:hypothetical protein Snoj_65750 [Streptomyces nojiriensis]|uniref:Uncharacterized protein n=1 Tax=Streptomyces nojiriensis TaxID=66374 RepID=A0ABQ3SX01_9ACTN|nr:hypothetical protein [Streptomyces nojiriensis]QTI46179.1 hypothetical protein JYK04_03990 [Streptomyces nojiriensis]GGR87420.1 hypothetical protein GCM10010205_14810 [Streptomyces nojiriensis]GHI72657.1 hypothetical protein Snoj_65750 [Streptomyces nojiriensis]
MANTPEVSVGPPGELGLRPVSVGGRRVGKAGSLKELRKILDRAGVEPGHEIHWLGGDHTVWPDVAWVRRTICFFMVVGLLATACPLFRIGMSDSGDALTYAGRIAGLTILAVAVVEALAALAAIDYWTKRRWRYSGVVVLVGVAISLLCSVVLLLLQIGERFTGYTEVGIALAVWSSVALYGLVKCGAWKGLRVPRKVAIGLIISTLLATANLAYSQIYLPFVTMPLIQSGAEFKESNMEKGSQRVYVTVHLFVKNAGQVPVYVLGSIYWVHGVPASSRFDAKPAAADLIYDGEFVSPVGRVLSPGEEVAQDAVIEIDGAVPHKYEAVRARTEVYVIRKDRMKMTADYERSLTSGKTLKDDCQPGDPANAEYRYRTPISNSSEVLNVTRGPQRITLWRLGGRNPHVIVDVSPPNARISYDPLHPRRNEEAAERYGLTYVRGSTAETPYAELLEKASTTDKGATPPSPSTASPTPTPTPTPTPFLPPLRPQPQAR